MEPKLSRKEVDDLILRVRRLVTGCPTWFAQIGRDLDKEYSHDACWLREVEKVNGRRAEVGSVRFSAEEIEHERGRRRSKVDEADTLARANRNDLLEMPLWDTSGFSSLHSRGYHLAWRVAPLILKPVSTTPGIAECGQLVLLTWAFMDGESQFFDPRLTAFQAWRDGLSEFISISLDEWDAERAQDEWLAAADRAVDFLARSGAVVEVKGKLARKPLPDPDKAVLLEFLDRLSGLDLDAQVSIDDVIEGFGLVGTPHRKFMASRYVTKTERPVGEHQLRRRSGRDRTPAGHLAPSEQQSWSVAEVRDAIAGWGKRLKIALT